jgi:hypothetical protein
MGIEDFVFHGVRIENVLQAILQCHSEVRRMKWELGRKVEVESSLLRPVRFRSRHTTCFPESVLAN